MENQGLVQENREISGIPRYGLRAYALFFSKYGSNGSFTQNELDWIVGQSMRKKIFSLLLKSGWIKKISREKYVCVAPNEIFKSMLEFKVPSVIKEAEKEYAFTGLSAVEIWSDYSYVQRGIEKSPYFIKIARKDLNYWKNFFNKHRIPVYTKEGSTIGEYVILIPVDEIKSVEKEGMKVESLKETMKLAGLNNFYAYAYNYIRRKYGGVAA
ncbi:MAG: hypothetical protein V1886_04490 [archaeon]